MLCPVLSCMREFKIPRRLRPRKCCLKSEFAFFQSLLRLFQFPYFVKCKRTTSGGEFLPIICKFRKRKKLSSSLLLFLYKTWNYILIAIFKSCSCSCACSDGKECTKKRAVRAELLFCPFNLLLFWWSRYGRNCSILNSLLFYSVFQTCKEKVKQMNYCTA